VALPRVKLSPWEGTQTVCPWRASASMTSCMTVDSAAATEQYSRPTVAICSAPGTPPTWSASGCEQITASKWLTPAFFSTV